MTPDQEDDFASQKTRLRILLDHRKSLVDGCATADHLNKEIIETEALIQSYRLLKWHEQGIAAYALAQRAAALSKGR